MEPGAWEDRRSRSFALFNNRHMADVAAHVLRLSSGGKDLFTTRQVASSTGLADSVVRPVLMRLVDAEILVKMPRLTHPRSAQYLQVVHVSALERLDELANVGLVSPPPGPR